MKLSELQGEEDYLQTPRIERSAIKLLWYSDYWDGPRSGMLEYQGKPYWFQICAEADADTKPTPDSSSPDGLQLTGWYRRYTLLKLSDAQLQEERYWHELFRQKVGTHTDYDEEEENSGEVRPKETHAEFYEPYKAYTRPDLSDNEVIGWFEL